MPDRAVQSDCTAAAEDIDEAPVVIWSHFVDDPQQFALASHPRDKAVQDAPSLKGKASSDCSNPRLAAAVDYSVDHMSVVERGVKAPKLEKLVAIANALNVGTDELLQDALNTATMLHATEISEKLKALPPEGQRKVMNVLDTLIAELQ